jgi:hypothetical protein
MHFKNQSFDYPRPKTPDLLRVNTERRSSALSLKPWVWCCRRFNGLASKMHLFLYIRCNPYTYMKRLFTPIFLILLLTIGAEQAFGENPIKYPGKLDIKFIDFRSLDFLSLYNPVDTVGKVSHLMRLQLETDKRIANQDSSGPKPMLNLGSIPEVLLKYQSDTVLQWGYSFKDLILLLRLGVKSEDFKDLEFQTRRENNYLSNLNLNFNFLIDFWFK